MEMSSLILQIHYIPFLSSKHPWLGEIKVQVFTMTESSVSHTLQEGIVLQGETNDARIRRIKTHLGWRFRVQKFNNTTLCYQRRQQTLRSNMIQYINFYNYYIFKSWIYYWSSTHNLDVLP